MELKVGRPVSKEMHINSFKLVIDHVHGDDDANTKKTVIFSKEEEPKLKRYLQLMEETEIGYFEGEVVEEVEQMGKDGLLEYDATNPEGYCHPSLNKLTWFNENGIEHKVTIT